MVHTAFGQSEETQIRQVIDEFIEGTVYNYPDKIVNAFYPEAHMFLHTPGDTLWKVSPATYASWYDNGRAGQANQRYNKITDLDIELDVAYAKIEVDIPSFHNRYYDFLLLKKIEGKWKIVAKCTSAEPIPVRPEEAMVKPAQRTVLEGLRHPWSMAFITEDEVLITEKDGDVLRVNLQDSTRQRVTGLPTDVARAITIDTAKFVSGVFPAALHGKSMSLNAGWFEVLLDPDFSDNGYVYLSYAAMHSDQLATTKVIRGTLLGNELTDVRTLLEATPYTKGLYHFGGGMVFGPDGKLYITVGERNFSEHLNPELPIAQDAQDRRGKIYRINPDGSIPMDNPDFGSDIPPGLYATGIRAAQGLAVQPGTGKIWFSEHGTHQGDELNVLEPGANYGWPYRTTGTYRTPNYQPEEPPGTHFKSPVYYWDQTVAPTGLTFYQGNYLGQWKGNLLVPGLSRGSLWRLTVAGDTVLSAEELFVNQRVRLRKVKVSPQGRLYLLTDEDNGKVIRVDNDNLLP